MVVGWYHSHPGFGCWFSGNTAAAAAAAAAKDVLEQQK